MLTLPAHHACSSLIRRRYDSQIATSVGMDCANLLRAGTRGAEASLSLVRQRLSMSSAYFSDVDVLYFLRTHTVPSSCSLACAST